MDTAVWSGLTVPTAMAFAPDGRVFVAEQSGVIKVFAGLAAMQPTVFADLSASVDNYRDRGLLGLAVDPGLGQPGHNFVYAFYTYDAPPGATAQVWNDQCPTPPGGTTDGCVVTNALVRIIVNADGTAGAVKNLISSQWCQQFPSHSAGHLAFGPDEMLYVSAGEGASYSSADYGQYGGTLAGTPTPANPCGDPPGGAGTALSPPNARGGALRAQSPRRPNGEPVLLNGSVLRVDPATGAGVSGNPMYDAANPQSNASRIIAYGLRNPFRFTFAPGSSEMWIGDVGYKTWEEIDRLSTPPTTPTPNFGWPCYEGSSQQPEYSAVGLDMCTSLYNDTAAAATAPWYTYSHASTLSPADTCKTGTSATSGLAFVQAQSYPSTYAGALFFGDYSRNCIWVMTKGANGQLDPSTVRTFIDDADNPRPVDLETDPVSGELFYVNILGSIHRISYSAPAVTLVSPTDASTGVSRTTGVVTLFNNPMDKPATQNAFSLRNTNDGTPINGTFSWFGNSALIFVPSAALGNNTSYTATASTAARDLNGVPLRTPKTWTFTTATQPVITAVSPANGAIDVYPNAAVIAVFDSAMDKPTAQTAFSLVRTSDSAAVSGSFSWYGNALIFKPNTNLGAGVQYTASVSTAAKDLAGHPLPAPTTWRFTTTTHPIISSIWPASSATGVSPGTLVLTGFSKAMDKASAQAAFSLVRTSNTAAVSGNFSWYGNALIFKPSIALQGGIQYTARVTSNAKDLNGNPILNPQTWRFTTGNN